MIDFVSRRGWFYAFSLAIMIPGIISLLMPNGLRRGIEFSSGSTFTARFGQDPAALQTIGAVDVFMSEWISGLAVTSHDVNHTTTAIFENPSLLLH